MMRFGVEARVPFLDPIVVKKALSIPFHLKNDPEKKILRSAYKDILPDQIVNQPKKALKFPFELIVKKEEVEKYIKGNNDEKANEMVNSLYKGLKHGEKNAARDLWNLFLFKKWMEINQIPETLEME